jgi:hypothetical protein
MNNEHPHVPISLKSLSRGASRLKAKTVKMGVFLISI